MNTPFVTLETSAVPVQERNQSLTQEVLRRLLRTDDKSPQEVKDNILNDFTVKMIKSGYSIKQTRDIEIAGIKCHKRKLKESLDTGKSINRDLRCRSSRLKRLVKKF